MTRLSMVRGGFLPVSLLLAIAGVGCGESDGGVVDMGRDLGSPTDMGPEDEGVDLGPMLPLAQVRVVHGVSDLLTATNVPINGIRLCVEVAGLGVIALPPNADLLDEIDLRLGLPFRAVTPYQETLPLSTVRVYDEARVDNDAVGAIQPAVTCPTAGLDANCGDDTVPCLFSFPFDPSTLERGESYSLVVSGFRDNTNTCLAGTVPCPTGAISATLEQDEDVDDVVAGSARVRFVHSIHNLPPADLCYDLDGLVLDGAAPTIIHAAVATGDISGYATVPAVTTGMVFLTLKNPLDASTLTGNCALSTTPAASGLPSNVVPVFFSPANAMAMPPNVEPSITAGTIITIYAMGDARYATPMGATQDDIDNFVGRTPLVLSFVDYAPAAP